MTFKHRKTREELEEALLRKASQLRRSIASYDEGNYDEAEQLAAILYTLLADGGKNTRSITGMLGIKQDLRFPESAEPQNADSHTIVIGPPLCAVGQTGFYFPKGKSQDAAYPEVGFNNWWDRVVYKTDRGLELTRKNLVWALRNQDGGGHVDEFLSSEPYYWLSGYGDVHIRSTAGEIPGVPKHISESVNYTVFMNPKWTAEGKNVSFRIYANLGNPRIATSVMWPPPADAKPLKWAHWATMRQMAWEVDEALRSVGR